MTTTTSTTTSTSAPTNGVAPFVAPAFTPLAAVRDRGEEARERAVALRESGYTDGYRTGLDAARQEVDQSVALHRAAATRLDQAVLTLERAAADLASRDAVTLNELERDAIALAVELATDIVGRELTSTPEPVLDALKRAAGLLPDRGTPIVRVHPDDAEVARAATSGSPWDAATAIVADVAIEPGGCVVDVGACRIDGQLRTAIERMRAVAG